MNKKGSVIIVSTLVIAIALIGVSTALMSTYLSGITLSKTSFREIVTQIASSSRGATAIALADITKSLNQREKIGAPSPYYDWSKLVLTESDIDRGNLLLQVFQDNYRQTYPATGLVLTYSEPTFLCKWTDPTTRTGYSVSTTNVNIDLLNYGFRGLKYDIIIETKAKLNNLLDTDGQDLTFTFEITNENGNVVSNLNKDLTKVYFAKYSNSLYRELTEKNINSLNYVAGEYIINCNLGYNTIDVNLDNLIQEVTSIPESRYILPGYKSTAINMLNEVKSYYLTYHSGDRSQSWLNIGWSELYLVRMKFDFSSPDVIVKTGTSTTDILSLTDLLLGQLRPYVRVVTTDFRGIAVSTYGEVSLSEGIPVVYNEKCSASGSNYIVTATADDRLGDNTNIKKAEYYISDSSTTIPNGAVSHNMNAVDGAYDSPIEELTTTVADSDLYPTTTFIWIRTQNANDKWSNYVKIKMPVLLIWQTINEDYIEIKGRSSGSHSNTRYWVEARVYVTNKQGVGLSGVNVQGQWSGSYTWNGAGTDLGGGYYIFQTPQRKMNQWPSVGGYKTFMIQVTSLTKTGYLWTGSPHSAKVRLALNGSWVY
jgi:hypothetical protein